MTTRGADGLTGWERKMHRARQDAIRSERCGRCGYTRNNVRHETDREHAPEGLAYYADVPFCDFLPTGESVQR